MTIDAWLQAAVADAERRGLPELKPILETLARATSALRAADFNDHANGSPRSAVGSPRSAVSSRQSAGRSQQATGEKR